MLDFTNYGLKTKDAVSTRKKTITTMLCTKANRLK